MKYVYHDKNEIVATDGFQLVVIHVDKERDNTYYDYSGAMTFPRENFPKYKSVIPKRIENNNILDLKLLIEQVKGVDKANSFFNKKTNELPAVKLLFKANEQQIFTSPKVTLKALMSLWMSGVTAVDVSVTSKNSVMFHDADDDKTLAVVMAIMSGTDTLFTPILGNGIN
jgi:DNA polymerase III sliding clamp (beta) subunit (PCNA family)